MKKINDHIIYTIKDIHQYFTGKLSSTEMHAIEKAALNDSLLAEAMDGYSSAFKDEKSFSQLEKDLTILKKKITHNNNYLKDNSWWKIAASFLLLTGACFAFYFVSHNNKPTEAGIIQQPVLRSKETKDSVIFVDKKATPSFPEQEDVAINSPAKSKAAKNNIEVKKITSDKSSDLVSSEAAAPVSIASEDRISEEKKPEAVHNNKAARFSLSKKSLLKKDTSGDNTRAESQVYVLYKNDAEPLIGWSTYLHYLQTQLSYSTYDDGRQVTGEMIVTFKIDATNNIPVNFDFEKSIDADVNNAVQELIQNGPQWKKISNTPVTGTVRLKIIF